MGIGSHHFSVDSIGTVSTEQYVIKISYTGKRRFLYKIKRFIVTRVSAFDYTFINCHGGRLIDGAIAYKTLFARFIQCLREDIHERDGSGDAFVGEETGHSDHSSSSILLFYNLVSFYFLGAQFLGQSQNVESKVTRSLGGLSSEVISGVSNTLSLSDGNEEENGSEESGAFRSKDTEGLRPVGAFRGTLEVHSKSHATLWYNDFRQSD